MIKGLFLSIALLISVMVFSQEQNIVKHNLNVKLNIATAQIEVVDSIEISSDAREFRLNSELIPFANSKNIELQKIDDKSTAKDVGMDREDGSDVSTTLWKIKGDAKKFVISYKGKISPKKDNSSANYQRGFTSISGVISEQGVYLAGSTFWIPTFENTTIVYSLTTQLPSNWSNVSQGKRVDVLKTARFHSETWICDKPQEEAYLIAAKFTEYSYKMSNGVMAMAFLRTPDEAIANKYLEVTEQYMNMYVEMLGNYPYSKFALVENFWETGYGMPSFTLLGEKIIRFPFILHSSYPHELLHNWWGNSVYVDFQSGNWCEGITAYMADHLIKEQRGQGQNYRRSTLQKFSNYVNAENDFALNKFIGRTDGPSEAIGYGKALMMWQMLRRKVGDETFVKGMKLFYDNNKYKTASYSDIRVAMEKVSDMDLKAFFEQWTSRLGAPQIAISNYKVDSYGGKYRIRLSMEQQQKSDVFNIDIPIYIITNKGTEEIVVNMDSRNQDFQLSVSAKPLKLFVDPMYDVFRILTQDEVPPTLSKVWGNKENIIILPKKANKAQRKLYEELAEKWVAADNDNFEVKYDSEIKELPEGKSLWILGFENKYISEVDFEMQNYKSKLDGDSVIFEGKRMLKKGNSFIFTSFDKNVKSKQNIFIATDNVAAIAGLVRKLPHYGKYSYLAFSGNEPMNIAKGQWPIFNSPLIKNIDENSSKLTLDVEREALAYLKPVFSESRMMKDIKFMASEEMKGRGIGTPEIDMVAEYIAKEFQNAGLKSFNNSYYQKFTHKFDAKGEMKLTNVIGYIEGTDASLRDNPVVVSAHYDHLGLGWPDVRKGNKGKIHYGADDNASGVATIIELARSMAKSAKPKRSIIFLACTAEEAGLIGSRYFVEHRKDYIKGEIFANVNVDTDGSLFDTKLLVLNANTAKEWKFIFMGTNYTTGIQSEVIEKQLDASDQMSFIEQGIPAIQLFTGPTQNYHRPSDTYDKIDGEGLVKVCTVSKEVILYLADRENAMPFTGENAPAKPKTSHKPSNSQRVGTGVVPDFANHGKGVKIGSVVEGSAAATAGLLSGDIIIGIDKQKIDDLKQYSDELKKHKPGDVVAIKVLRKEDEKVFKIKLVER